MITNYKILIPFGDEKIIDIAKISNVIFEFYDNERIQIKLHPKLNTIEIRDMDWIEFEVIQCLSKFGDVIIKKIENNG